MEHEWQRIEAFGTVKNVCKLCHIEQGTEPQGELGKCETRQALLKNQETPVTRVTMPTNPLAFIQSLDADAIESQIADMEGQIEGLRELLKVARAKGKRKVKSNGAIA